MWISHEVRLMQGPLTFAKAEFTIGKYSYIESRLVYKVDGYTCEWIVTQCWFESDWFLHEDALENFLSYS